MPKIHHFTRKQLKSKKASNFKHGDMIKVSNYIIHIVCKNGTRDNSPPTPFKCWVEDYNTFKSLDCTPGVRGGRPYYIDDFLHR